MLIEAFRVAFRGLLANKLRALLTMLGIIIGVGAVITLLSLGQAVQGLITGELQGLGSNQIFLFGVSVPSKNGSRAIPGELTNEDVAAIADPLLVPAAAGISPEYQGRATVVAGRQNTRTNIAGVQPQYLAVRSATLADGRFFEAANIEARSRVAVLGFKVKQDLFGSDPAVGQRVKIDGLAFEVIGVMVEKGGIFGSDADDQVLIPITTAQTRLYNPERRNEVSFVAIQAVNDQNIDAVIAQVQSVLRERHRLTYQDNNFSMITQKDLIATFGVITGSITVFLAAIAAISLIVGGIGIMNIMLVSVTERTREIGLRKAVGAKRRDIRLQFLIEAMVISLMGGMIGIGLGFGLTQLGSAILVRVATTIKVTVSVQPSSVVLATLFSAAVGIFFGLYPAIRASRLSPIEALRYE